MEGGSHGRLKMLPVILILTAVPWFYDILKIIVIKGSSITGYNLMPISGLQSVFKLGPFDITPAYLHMLPSTEQIGLLPGTGQSLNIIDLSWGGIVSHIAFIFIGGLLAGGYLGIVKDIHRERSPKPKVFFQFSWYYGPRLFLLLLLKFIAFTVFTSLGFEHGGLIIGLMFSLAPILIITEDCGIIEALLASPAILLSHITFCLRIFFCYSAMGIALSVFNRFFPFGGGILAFILWPVVSTYIILDVAEYFCAVMKDGPLAQLPRERLRGYGPTLFKSIIIITAFITIAGLPTALSKHRYYSALLPWHKPVIVREGYAYKTRGSLVYSKQNNLKKAKLFIDNIYPSPEEIAYIKPGLIRGKGRILADAKTIYFSFELTRSVLGEDVVYSLQNGGKIDATDGIWGNPVDRGVVLAMTSDLESVSGVFYDKGDYTDVTTLWDDGGKAIFLGPGSNKPQLYGIYADNNTEMTPVEFQWLYNRAIRWAPEGEKSPIIIMERLNNAFETLDLDFLLNALYYVKELQPENLLSDLKFNFDSLRLQRQAEGLEDWEDTMDSDFSYYPISDVKMGIVGDYNFSEKKVGFRAEIYKIGSKWKLTKVIINV